jgi:hypothetical protein
LYLKSYHPFVAAVFAVAVGRPGGHQVQRVSCALLSHPNRAMI